MLSAQQIHDKNFDATGIDISFKNITYSVQIPSKGQGFVIPCFPCLQSKQKKYLLNNVSGIFKAGEVSAIMGASGAGKTTLLNVLACRVPLINQSGQIFANNINYTYEDFGDFANYVMQGDVLMETMTVRQTLKFAADLRLEVGEVEKLQVISQLAYNLKLQNCMETLVGGTLLKGISGGQKKRTSIAFQLISNPQVIMLDEPTSGLDSLTSYIIVKYLSLARNQNKTVIMTIHQPNSEIFQLFTKLVLMIEGKFIYYGPTGEASDYFSKKFNLTCPEFTNPADFFISVIHHENQLNIQRYVQYIETFESTFSKQVEHQIQSRRMEIFQKRKVNVSCWTEFKVLVGRDVRNIIRNPLMVKARLFQTIVLTIYVSGLFCKFKDDYTNVINWRALTGYFFFFSMHNIFISLTPVTIIFPKERTVFLKEEGAKLYGVTAYFLSRNTVQIPYTIIFPIVQSLIMYWFVGLSSTPQQFFLFFFIIYLMNFTGMSLGFMIGSIVQDGKSVGAVTMLLLIPFIVFSGFFKNQNNLPNWVGWIQYASPFKYSFIAYTSNEVQYKDSLIGLLHFDVSMWGCIGALIALGLGFRLASWFFLWKFRAKLQ